MSRPLTTLAASPSASGFCWKGSAFSQDPQPSEEEVKTAEAEEEVEARS